MEWQPFRGFGRRMYQPKIDVAVGPFAVDGRYGAEYDRLFEGSRPFIGCLVEAHNHNLDHDDDRTFLEEMRQFNANARCFLCNEIENSGSKKHCIGDLVNASGLGRVGLLIAWDYSVLRVFLRQRRYLHYLASAGKNTFKTTNALILTAQQFDECLSQL